MWVSEVDFQQSEVPDWVREGQEDQTATWFFKRPMVVIPYVENVSESIARIMRKHHEPAAVKPYKTLKSVLVHPKDKQEKEDLTECV